MEVILLQKIENLGALGDKVTVKAGYGRNYLVPTGRAVSATRENLEAFEARRAELEKEAAEDLAAAEARKAKIEELSISVSRKAGDEGRLFGSVGPAEVVDALAAQAGLETDRSHVLGDTVKDVGLHEFTVQLHPEVAVPVGVEVEASD